MIGLCIKKNLISTYLCTHHSYFLHYSLIAFDERVTFWLQRIQSLPCACVYVALFVRRLAYNHYAIAHAYNAANKHAQGSDPARWSQKVTLSLIEGNRSIEVFNFNQFFFLIITKNLNSCFLKNYLLMIFTRETNNSWHTFLWLHTYFSQKHT